MGGHEGETVAIEEIRDRLEKVKTAIQERRVKDHVYLGRYINGHTHIPLSEELSSLYREEIFLNRFLRKNTHGVKIVLKK